jgi:hypothetical protein
MVIRAESKTENRSSSIGFGEFTREMNRLRGEHGAALVAGENWQWPAIVSDQDKRLTDRLVPASSLRFANPVSNRSRFSNDSSN